MDVSIIDYGSGNLKSVSKAFERAAREAGISANIEVTSDAERVLVADRIVLPGVGAFADCREGLTAVDGMLAVLQERVYQGTVPFLGICVGMQLMSTRGLERVTTPGLNWLEGEVVKLQPKDQEIKIPQIGWNTLNAAGPKRSNHPLLKEIEVGENGLHAYFVHSYHFQTKNRDDVLLTTDYGQEVTAMVAHNNMAGTQFHPEKSQTLGLALITNFLRWKP